MKNQVELRPRTLIAIALNALALGALAGLLIFADARQRLFDPSAPSRDVGTALIGGPFKLISHTGNLVSDTTFRGRAMIVTFGFTNEPDLNARHLAECCPERWIASAPRPTVWLPFSSPSIPSAIRRPTSLNIWKNSILRLIGLTGTAREIAAVAKAYRMPVELVVDPATPSQTTIEYEPLIYLMNSEGEYVAHMTHDFSADAIMLAVEPFL